MMLFSYSSRSFKGHDQFSNSEFDFNKDVFACCVPVRRDINDRDDCDGDISEIGSFVPLRKISDFSADNNGTTKIEYEGLPTDGVTALNGLFSLCTFETPNNEKAGKNFYTSKGKKRSSEEFFNTQLTYSTCSEDSSIGSESGIESIDFAPSYKASKIIVKRKPFDFSAIFTLDGKSEVAEVVKKRMLSTLTSLTPSGKGNKSYPSSPIKKLDRIEEANDDKSSLPAEIRRRRRLKLTVSRNRAPYQRTSKNLAKHTKSCIQHNTPKKNRIIRLGSCITPMAAPFLSGIPTTPIRRDSYAAITRGLL